MQSATYPAVKDLVFVGGGHAHALVLLAWAMKPLAGVRVTVINPGPAAPYTGMLPGFVAGHYTRDDIMIDLVRLARRGGARLILDRATGIDREARCVHLAGRPPLTYDLLSVDVGIGSDLPDIPGYSEYGVAAKPLGRYAEAWDGFLAKALPNPRLVIVGGGIGGIELALASHHRLTGLGRAPQITVIERSAAVLPNIGAAARSSLLAHVDRAGIRLITGAEVAQIGADSLRLTTGETLASDFTLTVAGTRPQGWLAQTGLDLHQGFISVGPTLQSSDPLIFAVGDCAHLSHAPRPKAGVFAVREAPVLAHNLRAVLTESGRLKPYVPQRDYLKLVSTGGKGAVADKFGLRSGGAWLWRLKDRIDRKFMVMFSDIPAMPAPALPPKPRVPGLVEAIGPKPLCGGCGAKLGSDGLAAALGALPAPQRSDVLSGRGDDAAVLASGSGVQVITTDHLRSFTNDPRLMARIAANHALGDIFAMGARPQIAVAQVILPHLSDTLAARTLAEIMDEAAQVFAAEGADVVGGHSSVGAELTVGFTVTGLADRAILKGGARAGDVLVLTKRLGTGTIMAAEMVNAALPGQILGEAVAAAFASMTRSLGPAARALAPVARAMTDVTGFGLAGHVLELCEASGVSAQIDLQDLPLLPAAEALAARGEASSIAPANRVACLGRIAGDLTSTRAALMFDPQTCGGLLAAIPPEAVAELLASLPEAQVIGKITAGPAKLTLI